MLGAALDLEPYVARLQAELAQVDPAETRRMADLIYQAWEQERFVFIFGNGGSGCNASHMAEDIGKASRECDLKDESRSRLKVPT